jgi:hypothetical protein
MLGAIDRFYLEKEEPVKSCLLALKEIIINLDENISTAWKYKVPFFCYKGKMFCYLWIDRKTKEPYIGVVEGNRIEHPSLEQGNRKRMKILRVNSNEDFPVETIELILNHALNFYRNGIIKL